MEELNLADYYRLFPDALRERYGATFEVGFENVKCRFDAVRRGAPLTPDDVMAIFDPSLPFHRDWTKPDRTHLEGRMGEHHASELIHELDARYDLSLLGKIVDCFRELSLTALVLHHVYPEKYSICSHHIGSLLYITGHHKGGTVPGYYLEYCQELQRWGTRFKLNVMETEFALWTWYRLAHYGEKASQKEHLRRFNRDPWVRKRRAIRIADSLKVVDKLGFARFFLDTDPTLGAIIAWREFEVKARSLLYQTGVREVFDCQFKMGRVFAQLPKGQNINYDALWKNRDRVMHDDATISDLDAKAVVSEVVKFIEANQGKFGLD